MCAGMNQFATLRPHNTFKLTFGWGVESHSSDLNEAVKKGAPITPEQQAMSGRRW